MQIFADKKFENPIGIIEAFDNESFFEAFKKIEDLRKRPDTFLLGYIRYEAKDIFLNKKADCEQRLKGKTTLLPEMPFNASNQEVKSKLPLLYFEVFRGKCMGEFCEQNSPIPSCLKIEPKIGYRTYSKAIEKIKEEIAQGNTYQVNYTYNWKIETNLDGFELYQNILPRQKTPYNAYIKNKYEEILSFSPELFFTLEGNKILTKPMKGTVKRGVNDEEDEKNIEFLKNDIKNRAENVMIVDLLRNDLGKIAKTGTVTVEKLFEIETHKTVHQMTSEISAELEDDTTLYQIFEALFPCGSVTGTPKINTMEIINDLEKGKREVYCGAIGLISSEKTVFSVPIRILQKPKNQNFFLCRVGGAIVWDSTAQDEWEETLTKIKFLQDDFQLVETMLVENGKILYEKEHFSRMKKSAKILGFKFNKQKIKLNEKNCILRILLDKEGVLQTQELPLEPIKTNKISISKIPVNSQEPLLYHKTTWRPWYEESMKKIKAGEIFDEIFFNEKGELTEGARSNVVLQIDGELFTPPVSCGMLNGILRQKMIKEGKLKEKILNLNDLEKAQKIFCINSVRGITEVEAAINVGAGVNCR